MQHDEVIWQVINQNFCSYKVKAQTQNFCKHEQNVTGLCNRSSCPLANSRYASVQEDQGMCYLWVKTIERAHSPLNMWEKIKLSRNYAKALEQIDKHLEFWPKFMIHKNKQRITKIHQYLIRMRKLKLKVQPTIVGINKKVDRREAQREKKALKASRLTNAITDELITRLKSGVYGDDIMNFPVKEYATAVDSVGQADEVQEESEEDSEEIEFVEGYDEDEDDVEDLMEKIKEKGLGGNQMEDDEGDEDDEDDDDGESDDEDANEEGVPVEAEDEDGEDEDDDEDEDDEDGDSDDEEETPKPPSTKRKAAGAASKKESKGKKTRRVEVEYEHEMEEEEGQQLREGN